MKIKLLFLFYFVSSTFCYSQLSGTGHFPNNTLGYTPSGYSSTDILMRQGNSVLNGSNPYISDIDVTDLYVNFTFDTSGKNVYIVYTTDGTIPSKSQGNTITCSFSNYTDPNRTWVGSIPNSANIGGNEIRYVFYISNSDLANSWGRIGSDGYKTNWTEGDTYFTYNVWYSSIHDGDWSNLSTWKSNNVPSGSKSVLINNSINQDQNISIADLLIRNGKSLTVNAGEQLAITSTFTNNGTLNLNSDASGTAVILTPSSITGTGTSNINQYFNATLSRNWYISSPVTGATVPTGQTYYSYLEDGSNTGFTSPATAYWKANAAGTTLSAGTGYIAQPTATSGTFTFSGTLNTGTVGPLSLSRTSLATKPGFNLVGNPFPAYLNIDGLASNANLEPTYWYRSYNGAYVFDTYNIPSALSTGSSGFTVSKYIPPMQAFWLRVASGQTSASVSFSSSDCAVQDDSNNKFRAPAAKNTVQKVLRLDVTDGTTTDETILYANPNAYDSFDAYDSHKMTNSSDVIPEIYTTVGAEQLAINGMNSIPMDTPIPLGFTTGVNNTFTISAKEFSNFDPGIKVYLVDNQNNTQNDLTASPYTFDASASSDTRFAVVLSSSVATGINTARKNTFTAYSNSNGSIVIQNNLNSNQQVDIFNSTGQKVFSSSLTTNPAIVSPNLQAGIYLIQLTTINNKYIKKITIN